MRANGKNAVLANVDQKPHLSPASKDKKVMATFNDAFTALVNNGSASVKAESTTVKSPVDGKTELPYDFPRVSVKVGNGSALAYFNDPILDKDGKEIGRGYRSADGKTTLSPEELLDEAISTYITNKEKASARQKAVNAAIPDEDKAVFSAARKMVLAGSFGGEKDGDIKSEQNVKAMEKAVKVLKAAAAASNE